jgi:hypothetical protein
MAGKKKLKNTNHYTKQIPLRNLSLRVLIDLHQFLRIRPNGDDHPTRSRELFHKRRRYRPCRRSNMNSVIRALLSVPYTHTVSYTHNTKYIFKNMDFRFFFAPEQKERR